MSRVRVFTNGKILSPDGIVDTFSVSNGRIESIGKTPGKSNAETVDLNGRCVIPGFIDAHTHMLRLGLEINGLSLEGIGSREDALRKVREYALRPDVERIVGYGWDESLWKDNEFLYSDDLLFTEKPVVLYRRDEHMAVVNDSVLRSLGITGIDGKNGIIKEEGLRSLRDLMKPNSSDTVSALDSAIAKATSLGVTAVRDIVDAFTDRIYSRMKTNFHVSRAIYDHDCYPGYTSTDGRWGVKTFLDGSVGSLTAAHSQWNSSNLKLDRNSLERHLRSFWDRHLPVAVHAIGEQAVEEAVDVLSTSPGRIVNSIEHFELVEDDILERVTSGTVISAQPNFLIWAGKNGMYERNLGSEWLRKNNVFRKILDLELPLAFGSDCMPMGPAFGIMKAVRSEFPEQRITIMEGIRAYTEGSASLLGLGSRKGKIAQGFDADFAVFEPDFLSKGVTDGKYEPLETYIGGDKVFSRHGEGT